MTVENSNATQGDNDNVVNSSESNFEFVGEEIQEEVDTSEVDKPETNTENKEETAEDEEVELYLGDEELPASSAEEEKNPDLVKNLRKEIQARNKRIQELESGTTTTKSAVDVNEKLVLPTLESANYDEDNYQKALITYFDKKAAQEKAKLEAEEQNKQFQAQHQERIKAYNERKAQIKVKDYADMEKIVIDEVPDSVQGAILHYASQPELVVLALGRNATLRKQIAETTDPVKLGILIGNLEAKAKLLPKSKVDKPQSTPQVKGKSGGKLQDFNDASFRKLFPDAIID